jgi:acyl-coenzyme A synthetase/AMP-(fatty) acid ligase
VGGDQAHNLAVILDDRAHAGGWYDRPAFFEPGRTWSHCDVHRGAEAVAAGLSDAGVGVGDRILVATADCIQFVWALLAAARLGAIAVLVNPTLPADDHRFMVGDCEATYAVCDTSLLDRFEAVIHAITVDDIAAVAEAGTGLAGEVPAAAVTPSTACYAQYTSGTTGRPKAALHRHSDPAGYHRAVGEGVLGLGPEDVVLSVSKCFFAYGLGNTVFFPLSSGAAAVLHPDRPTVSSVAWEAAARRVTVLFAVPSFYARLVAQGDPGAFESLRTAVSAGEALAPALYRRSTAWLGCDVLDGLGSTEVGQTFISNTPGRSRAGTVGTVLAGYEASVRDNHGRPLPRGETGSLWVRGATVTPGYLNRPEETAAVLVDGWWRTGDRASADADGYYTLHGREDDTEIVGGINVAPLEVETVLLEHPSVLEVAVVSLPDAIGATQLQCFAVLDPAVAWSPALEGQVLDLARSRLAAFKVPRSVTPVATLPRTATGKLRRHVLRAGWPPAGVGSA